MCLRGLPHICRYAILVISDPTSTRDWRQLLREAFFVCASLGIVATQLVMLVFVSTEVVTAQCTADTQDGCQTGEYCSLAFAAGQCNDCSVLLPETTTCCPSRTRTSKCHGPRGSQHTRGERW